MPCLDKPPTAPTELTQAADPTTATLSWHAATDDVAVAGYGLYIGNVLIASTTSTSFVPSTGLSAAQLTAWHCRRFRRSGEPIVRRDDVAGNCICLFRHRSTDGIP